MAICESCGKKSFELIEHSVTGEKLCLTCMSASGVFKAVRDEFAEKRAAPRFPVKINLQLDFCKDTGAQMTYPGAGVNISSTGLCFTWEYGNAVTGDGSAVGQESIFFPHAMSNPAAEPLKVVLNLENSVNLEVKCKIAYCTVGPQEGVDYIGVAFVELSDAENDQLRANCPLGLTDAAG